MTWEWEMIGKKAVETVDPKHRFWNQTAFSMRLISALGSHFAFLRLRELINKMKIIIIPILWDCLDIKGYNVHITLSIVPDTH